MADPEAANSPINSPTEAKAAANRTDASAEGGDDWGGVDFKSYVEKTATKSIFKEKSS